MRRASLAASAAVVSLVVGLATGQPEEPFPPKGDYNHSVHRYFPDLDARLNAVRYGRWRALEIAWTSGIDARSDKTLSSYFLRIVAEPPRFDPDALRVAPRFAREATSLFRALRWGQVLEAQTLDILASPDSTDAVAQQRIARVLSLYRREPWALNALPAEAAPSEAIAAAPASAQILLAGTRFFALAAEDLAASDFGQQRWRVKKTVDGYDYAPSAEIPVEAASYRVTSPTVAARFPEMADQLDRIGHLRRDLFGALVPGTATKQARSARDARARDLARRWGLPAEGIGER